MFLSDGNKLWSILKYDKITDNCFKCGIDHILILIIALKIILDQTKFVNFWYKNTCTKQSSERLKNWAYIHLMVRRLIARSREVNKPRESALNFSNQCEIGQQCCRDSCQNSKRHDHCNIQFSEFETSRDLVVRRLPAKWIEALLLNAYIFTPIDT